MNSDVYDRLDELADANTDNSTHYKTIRKLVTRAPGLNEVYMRTLREHFTLPDTIRNLELNSLLVKMEYYYNTHISEQASNDTLVTASLPTTSPPVASNLTVTPHTTISGSAITISGPAISIPTHKTSPPSAPLEVERSVFTHEKPISAVNRKTDRIAKETSGQTSAANTIKVTFSKAHPKVVLRGRDYFNKVDPRSLKILKRREMANSEIRYSMEDKQGNIKLFNLRSLASIWHQLETHEHSIIAKCLRKAPSNQPADRNPLLQYLRKRPPTREAGANGMMKGAKILNPLPLEFSGYDAMKACICYVCRQVHSLNMIHCTRCWLFAHTHCLPDNEDSVQEWINERVACNFCSSYALQTAESIQGSFELLYETNFFGKPVTYKVDCKVVRFKDSNSIQEATVPTLWLKTFAPKLFASDG